MLRLIPDNTKIGFMGARKFCYGLSILGIVASIALFFSVGLNYGIDFEGGLAVEIGTTNDSAIDIGQVRGSLSSLGLGDVSVQEYGRPSEALIRVERQPGDDAAQKAALDLVRATLEKTVPDVSFRQENVIGPKVSGELKRDGIIAISVALAAVLIYIWFRFEWQFGAGAVIALFHDVILTIGFFAITQLEFNLSVIAALLTIVGYSLNDTVVVYDRIRENIRKFRKMEVPELIDFSLNQTLSRTTMTSFTTLLALLGLYIFGGEVIRGFTAAMIWGIFVGTYSSIFVASPLLTLMKLDREHMFNDVQDNDPTVDKSRSVDPFAN
ncbi:protein translocase subunit SecF [Gimibacter soli]|uniref:Protein-export membrane protein SecF n=1 Tax=Gimibacter soli TaxID=3024400 RepID=A0AAF0BLF8_9PROT|nr:protein translocase subunit SecF [Gimibacter soli]WCL53116.1 protein translocase subunit SecF [Gimibacter soli]